MDSDQLCLTNYTTPANANCLTNSVCSAAAHYLPALTKQINFIIFIIADCWTRASRASSLCVANNAKEDFSQVR